MELTRSFSRSPESGGGRRRSQLEPSVTQERRRAQKRGKQPSRTKSARAKSIAAAASGVLLGPNSGTGAPGWDSPLGTSPTEQGPC